MLQSRLRNRRIHSRTGEVYHAIFDSATVEAEHNRPFIIQPETDNDEASQVQRIHQYNENLPKVLSVLQRGLT